MVKSFRCIAVAEGYVNAIAKGKLTKLTPVWKNGVRAIYDTYLGECPEQFTYNGKTYTPRTFADEALGLNMDDYVSLTSFTLQHRSARQLAQCAFIQPAY